MPGQQLQSNRPLQRNLLRFVDDPHTAAAKLADDSKIADPCGDAWLRLLLERIRRTAGSECLDDDKRWKKVADFVGQLWDSSGVLLDCRPLAGPITLDELVGQLLERIAIVLIDAQALILTYKSGNLRKDRF